MFQLAFLIGIYSYLIFGLGILKILNEFSILITTVLYLFIISMLFKNRIIQLYSDILIRIKETYSIKIECHSEAKSDTGQHLAKPKNPNRSFTDVQDDSSLSLKYKCLNDQLKSHKKERVKDSVLPLLFIALLCILAVVNLVGVLGPEYSFDSLWYHLTIPKLYILHHKIYYIPGGLLYYSAMPKLTEMLYIVGLAFHSEIAAKFIHFIFGIFTLIVLFTFSRKYFSKTISLFICLVFYSNLVVAWESTTAYIDLARTFYELLALWGFMNWIEKQNKLWLITSGVMLGFAISTKLLSFGTFGIYLPILTYISYKQSKNIIVTIKNCGIFITASVLTSLPWFIFAMKHTGNPVYPIFSGYQIGSLMHLISFWNVIKDFSTLFLFADDPISPLYVITLPLVIFLFRKFRRDLQLITFYSFLALLVWYVTPRTGGGRFILPYLPAFSVVTGEVLYILQKNRILKYILVIIILFITSITIGYRVIANSKYIPVITGNISKDEFLTKHLNYNFGDFYDIDNYFKQNITPKDTVLLYGFHNLYFVDFPFIDSSWIKSGDTFNYIAVQHGKIPEQFRKWQLVYQNDTTGVKVYTDNKLYYMY